MNIKLKLSLLQRLTDELDQHIWEVFNKYIKLKHINFNGPDNWAIQYDSIHFKGYDGCRGCYDAACEDIPIGWFIDYDTELIKHNEAVKLAEEKYEKSRQDQIELSRRVKEANDLVEYERLKRKFQIRLDCEESKD